MMTITIDYSEEELERLAYRHYMTDDSKQQWKTWQLQLAIASFFLSFAWLKSLPALYALPGMVGIGALVYFLVGCYFPIYVRRNVAEYIRTNAPAKYTITLTQEGIRYTEDGDSITYSWSALRSVEFPLEGYISLTLLEAPWTIPDTSFTDATHCENFLKALQAGRKGDTSGTPWWTQGNS